MNGHQRPELWDLTQEENQQMEELSAVFADAIRHDRLFDAICEVNHVEAMRLQNEEHKNCFFVHTGCSLDPTARIQ